MGEKETMKKLGSKLLCVAMACSMLACQKKETKTEGFQPKLDADYQGELHIGGLYDNFEALENAFEGFKEYYPNITTEYFHIDNYALAIDKAVVSEDAPDILFIKSYTFDYSKKYKNVQETALDLDEEDIDFSQINENFIRHTSDGHIEMFPTYVFTNGLLMNEKILKDNGISIPTTYSEFIQACDKLKEAGYAHPAIGYVGYDDLYTLPRCLAWGYYLNSVYGNKEACKAINSRDAKADEYLMKTLDFMQDFKDKDIVDTDISQSLEDHYNAVIMRFFEGDIPFVITGSETVTGMPKRENKSVAYSAHPFDYSFTVFPYSDQKATLPVYADYGMVVNKNARNKDVAVEFLRYLSQKENLDTFCDIKGAIRITKDSKQVDHLEPLNDYMDSIQRYGQESITQTEAGASHDAFWTYWNTGDKEAAIQKFHDYQEE